MKSHAWLRELHSVCQFMSVEVPGKVASGSELRRWIEQGSILVNGERIKPDELLDFPMISVVMFPKSEKRRSTIL